MYKILVIDKCCFSRLGLKHWLSRDYFREKNISLAEADNLQVASDAITTWQPNLIIADFNSFLTTLSNINLLSLIHEKCADNSKILLLQSHHHAQISDISKNRSHSYILNKSISLNELESIIEKNIIAPSQNKTKKRSATPLLTLREERILKLWKDETHNSYIAKLMGISIKTVYTYKRNIRIKLGAENRLSLFMNFS